MYGLIKKCVMFHSNGSSAARIYHVRPCVRIKALCEEWCIFWDKQSYEWIMRKILVSVCMLSLFLSRDFFFFLRPIFRTRVIPFLSTENDVFAAFLRFKYYC